MQCDLEHVLHAIVEGLFELQWPGVDHRAELANMYPGIFHGCIGVGDVEELQLKKGALLAGRKKLTVISFSQWQIIPVNLFL